MFFAFVCCLFVFLGMFIGNKFDFKKLSINALFGLFSMNCLLSILPYVYLVLYVNYHSSTSFYVLLSIILGYLFVKLINCKYEDSDNISILGFSFVNTSLFLFHSFNVLLFIVNIIYYVLIGIYIKKSKSWIFVFIGLILGIVVSFIDSWFIGYVYGISFSLVFYFAMSVYIIVFRSKGINSYIGLGVGFVAALFGCLL